MPTTDPRSRLQPHLVRDVVRAVAFADAGTDDQRGIGAEIELFGFSMQSGHPRRLRIEEQAARLDAMESVVGRRTSPDTLAPWPAGSGGLTFEPGGQLEYSSGVHATGAALMDDHDLVLDALARRWAETGDLLVGIGSDLWTDVEDIPQQLAAPRYEAMDAYLQLRGRAGRRMMRSTCALQINLDPGHGDEADARWRLANLVAPLVTATFASSPAASPDPAVSLRARAWRQLDPTRTGIPASRAMGERHDRVEAMTAFALAADVMMVHTDDGRAVPGLPGRSFAQWVEQPDDVLGWPTQDDLRRHLSTLFPEVRPRGPLELRSIDALPRRWRSVPVVLLTGLLYDPEAQAEGLRLLEPRAGQLQHDIVRAGEIGLKDAELCAAAVEVFTLALQGAVRLGEGWHRSDDLHATTRFIDTFTMRGLSPADEIRARFVEDPTGTMHWLAEPVGQSVLDLL